MNKKLVLLTAILVVSVGFLNGCIEESSDNENTADNNSNEEQFIEISDIKVTTEYREWDTYEYKVKDGFYHDYPKVVNVNYKISGKVKNICDTPIDSVSIDVKYHDASGNHLDDDPRGTIITDLYINETEDFKIETWKNDISYFEHVEDYSLDYSVNVHE